MITIIALIIAIVGSLNWISVGLLNFNFVNWICMGSMTAETVIYTIVGVAGLWLIYYLVKSWRHLANR